MSSGENIFNDLPSVLRRLRMEKGFSQTGLAQELGMSKQVVSKYESGDVTPPLAVLGKLLATLECSLSELESRLQEHSAVEGESPSRKEVEAIAKRAMREALNEIRNLAPPGTGGDEG